MTTWSRNGLCAPCGFRGGKEWFERWRMEISAVRLTVRVPPRATCGCGWLGLRGGGKDLSRPMLEPLGGVFLESPSRASPKEPLLAASSVCEAFAQRVSAPAVSRVAVLIAGYSACLSQLEVRELVYRGTRGKGSRRASEWFSGMRSGCGAERMPAAPRHRRYRRRGGIDFACRSSVSFKGSPRMALWADGICASSI